MTGGASRKLTARKGPIARAWLLLVLVLIYPALILVYGDLESALILARQDGLSAFQVNGCAWVLLCVAQVVNHVPVPYRYRYRFPDDALYLLGLTVAIAAGACLGLGIAVPRGLGRSLWLLVVAVWIVGSIVYRFSPRSGLDQPASIAGRVVGGVLVPLALNLPFAGAVLLLRES